MGNGSIRAGVLIVGSLLWDSTKNKDGWSRENWRKARLDLDQKVAVKVPIRYGRLSKNRKCYTMVMSHLLTETENHLGTGFFVPVRNPIHNVSDLILEARHMWGAELNWTDLPKRFSSTKSKWGGIALGPKPGSSHLTDLEEGWKKAVAENPGFYEAFEPASEELPIVNTRGLLEMPWPKTLDGKPLEADLVLATVTQPTYLRVRGGYERYATPFEIARAWNQLGEAEYFRKNRAHGIETFQDREILDHLEV